tara:strand:+ start:2374 stop:2532 length:159 start_codon:yes stop_codon:yes gene_type:complete
MGETHLKKEYRPAKIIIVYPMCWQCIFGAAARLVPMSDLYFLLRNPTAKALV